MDTLVLVSEDQVFPRERRDHSADLLQVYGRPQKSPAHVPLSMLLAQRPSPSLFEDRFVSVYPVLESFEQLIVSNPGQPLFALAHVSNRLDEPNPEDSTKRFDLTQIHRFRVKLAPLTYLVGIVQEIPDLNDDPWREWVHPGRDHPNTLQPFRQYIHPVIPQQWGMLQWRSPNWRVEAEADVFRIRSHAADFQEMRGQPEEGPFPAVKLEGYGVDLYTLTLWWSASPGAAAYRVYINGVPQTGTISGQTTTLSDLTLDTSYLFNIVAVNTKGFDASPLSNNLLFERSTTELIVVESLPWEDAGTIPEGPEGN